MLGLELWFDGLALQLWNPVTWHYLWTIDEMVERADAARARRRAPERANEEKARADEAEAQLEVEARARRAPKASIAALESKFKDN